MPAAGWAEDYRCGERGGNRDCRGGKIRIRMKSMKSKGHETQTAAARLADQLRRAFDGSAWHGPALIELLQDVDAAAAAAKPLPEVHSIWELVLHIAAWDSAACVRLAGKKHQPKGLAN